MIAAGTLSVAALAKIWRCNRTTALRRLQRIESKYGSKVVGRRGKRGALYTTVEAIRRVCPEFAAPAPRLDGQLAEIRETIAAIERRMRRLEAKVDAS